MPNPYFQFKNFIVYHDKCSMKVTTDSCLFGAWVANEIQNLNDKNNILDIGSGSGLLSLMIAQKTNAFIDGVEIQTSDYQQSLENTSKSLYRNQIKIYNANALIFNYDKQYDVIISNPPFYETDLKSIAQNKNIAHHNEGLKLQDLLGLIKKQLCVNGSFYLLLPAKRQSEIQQLTASHDLFINEIILVHQTEKHEAFRIMIKGSLKEQHQKTKHIIIKQESSYSFDFIELLKDYYLNL